MLQGVLERVDNPEAGDGGSSMSVMRMSTWHSTSVKEHSWLLVAMRRLLISKCSLLRCREWGNEYVHNAAGNLAECIGNGSKSSWTSVMHAE